MRPAAALLVLTLATAPAGCAQGAPEDAGSRLDAGPRDGSTPGDATLDDAEIPRVDAGCGEDETCNGADDDCDGRVDEMPTDGTMYFRDLDEDGWGSDTDTVVACSRPERAAERGGDCQDGTRLVNPESMETCDGLDNDCSGMVDEGVCAAGCAGVAFGGHGYAFCRGPVTWTAARDACVAAGMLLVRVDTMAENDFLFATASMAGGIGDHFIGARVEADGTNVWRWADGTELWMGVLGGSAVMGRFAAWETDQPDDNASPRCAVARDRMAGLWHDTSCDTPNDYVCERY